MILPITLTIAGAAAILHVWLSLRVSRLRRPLKIGVGDGGNEVLLRRMRAHGNFAENMPIFLILLGLLELATGGNLWLWGAAILFILARIAHAFGMDRPRRQPAARRRHLDQLARPARPRRLRDLHRLSEPADPARLRDLAGADRRRRARRRRGLRLVARTVAQLLALGDCQAPPVNDRPRDAGTRSESVVVAGRWGRQPLLDTEGRAAIRSCATNSSEDRRARRCPPRQCSLSRIWSATGPNRSPMLGVLALARSHGGARSSALSVGVVARADVGGTGQAAIVAGSARRADRALAVVDPADRA